MQFVELSSTSHGPKCGLGQLGCGVEVVLDLDDRLLGRHDAEVDHRVDLHRDVVPRDYVLTGDIEGDDPHADLHHAFDAWDQQDQARTPDANVATESKDHAPLVFAQHLDCRKQHDGAKEDQ